jgi:Uncharacterised methyltransferase family (DUF6094)
MALMFSRLAHNFAKNGYYPTDEVTLARILAALHTQADAISLLDPCCGEGTALAELKHHFEPFAKSLAYGVEYDAERAWHAKQLLDSVAHADIHDMAIKVRQFGLLFLNPPYGDLVADKAALSDTAPSKKRLEKVFYYKAHPWLAVGGILVLIVPHYVLDTELAQSISRQYSDVRVFMAPEDKFKQCVIFGIKRLSERADSMVCDQLEAIGCGQLPEVLPEHWTDSLYQVPATQDNLHFIAARINPLELADEIQRIAATSLWPQFERQFSQQIQTHRPPLCSLSQWHLALALAAGQLSGVVTSKSGRRLLVKGDTYKDKVLKVTIEETGKEGELREVRTLTDRFIPSIRAIDFTPGGMYGHLVSIQ